MLQLGTRSEGDAAHADVFGGDVVLLALVATGEGEAEGAQVIQLHAIAVEEGIGEVLPHGLQHGQHVGLGDAAGMVDVIGQLAGGDDFAPHDGDAHGGVLLGGTAGEVVALVELVGNGA